MYIYIYTCIYIYICISYIFLKVATILATPATPSLFFGPRCAPQEPKGSSKLPQDSHRGPLPSPSSWYLPPRIEKSDSHSPAEKRKQKKDQSCGPKVCERIELWWIMSLLYLVDGWKTWICFPKQKTLKHIPCTFSKMWIFHWENPFSNKHLQQIQEHAWWNTCIQGSAGLSPRT